MKDTLRGKSKIDWIATVLPLLVIMGLCAVFMSAPQQSAMILDRVRLFLGDTCGLYYADLGLGIFCDTVFMGI